MVQKVVLFLEPSNFCCCLCPNWNLTILIIFCNISSRSSLSFISSRSVWPASSLLIFRFKDSLQRLWLMKLGFLMLSYDNIDIHVPPQRTRRGIYCIYCRKLNILFKLSEHYKFKKSHTAAPDIYWVCWNNRVKWLSSIWPLTQLYADQTYAEYMIPDIYRCRVYDPAMLDSSFSNLWYNSFSVWQCGIYICTRQRWWP